MILSLVPFSLYEQKKLSEKVIFLCRQVESIPEVETGHYLICIWPLNASNQL